VSAGEVRKRQVFFGLAVAILMTLLGYIGFVMVIDSLGGIAVASVGFGAVSGLFSAWAARGLLARAVAREAEAQARNAQSTVAGTDHRVLRPLPFASVAGMVVAISAYVFLGPSASNAGYGVAAVCVVLAMALAWVAAQRINMRRL